VGIDCETCSFPSFIQSKVAFYRFVMRSQSYRQLRVSKIDALLSAGLMNLQVARFIQI
jgi:hypothetical protein